VTNNKYAASLPKQITSAVSKFDLSAADLKQLIAAAKLGTAAAYKAVPGITPQIIAAAALGNKKAYLQGAHLSYEVAVAFGVLGCIAALFVKTIDTRKYTKNTVALQEADRKALKEKSEILS
jgi:hypothetical protein